MKRKIPILSALAAGSILLSSCGIIPEEESFYAAPTISNSVFVDYTMSVCAVTDIYQEEVISVKYIPVQTASLNFPINGITYDTFFVSLGETVTEGQLLAQLNMGTLQEDLAACQRNLDACSLQLSQLEDSRSMALKKQQYDGSGWDPSDQQRALNNINHQFDRQKQSIEDQIYLTEFRMTEIDEKMKERQLFAPFDGVVSYVYSPETGDVSSNLKKVINISDSSLSVFRAETKLWDQFDIGSIHTAVVSEREYGVTVIDAAEIGLNTEKRTPGKSGDVYFALNEPVFDLEDNAKGSITIVTVDKKDVKAVPTAAISNINGKDVVYILGDDGLRTFRYVNTGVRNERYVEILDGLEIGDEVIIN